jgi:acyl-CoA synthetase (AMP-forming)/AMP-acid ligase II
MGVPVPDQVGELAIAGSQLMSGYWNRPDDTAAKTTILDSEVYYKTGDICEVDSEGNYYFKGRRDNEVKIRGYRTNLEEVHKTLLHDGRVREAVVGVVRVKSADPVLGVALVLKSYDEGDLSSPKIISEIITALKQHLPGYMVPQYGMICDTFPKLASGKTDKRRTIELLNHGVDSCRSRFVRLDRGSLRPLA